MSNTSFSFVYTVDTTATPIMAYALGVFGDSPILEDILAAGENGYDILEYTAEALDSMPIPTGNIGKLYATWDEFNETYTFSLSIPSGSAGKILRLGPGLPNSIEIPMASSSSDGFMSSSDKTKLDSVAEGATAITVDPALNGTSANPVENKAIVTALDQKSDTSHTHTFASLTSTPTTLVGYGITDAASSSHAHTFTSLTSKPTTISGYGITDAVTIANAQTITGSKTFSAGLFGNSVALSSGSIDVSTGTVFTKTISAATTITFTGEPASGSVACVTLILTNGGAYTVTWDTAVKWTEGTAPDLTASGIDVLTFLTIDGGTTWYGTVNLSAAA